MSVDRMKEPLARVGTGRRTDALDVTQEGQQSGDAAEGNRLYPTAAERPDHQRTLIQLTKPMPPPSG